MKIRSILWAIPSFVCLGCVVSAQENRPAAAAVQGVKGVKQEAVQKIKSVETGTAKGRFDGDVALAGVTVYGKTGTATSTGTDWKSDDVEDQLAKGPWHLWFVGYSMKPGTPTLAFACVLHARKTGAGGDLAAPVVARFLHYWYSR